MTLQQKICVFGGNQLSLQIYVRINYLTWTYEILIQKTSNIFLSDRICFKSTLTGVLEKKLNRICHLRLMTLYGGESGPYIVSFIKGVTKLVYRVINLKWQILLSFFSKTPVKVNLKQILSERNILDIFCIKIS